MPTVWFIIVSVMIAATRGLRNAERPGRPARSHAVLPGILGTGRGTVYRPAVVFRNFRKIICEKSVPKGRREGSTSGRPASP